MPFITCKVNRPISREQEMELKARMGKAIELVPGKSEQYLLLASESERRLWLRGDDSQPVAYIDAARRRPEEFQKRLISFMDKTRKGKMIMGYGGVEKYYRKEQQE